MGEKLLLSFYGDDLTGSCDAMEALALGGVRTALFLEPPAPALLRERFPALQALGVAGVSRTMTPARMDEALPPVFAQLSRLDAAIFHYKVCSTFDSAPEVGSIGRAIDIGQQVFQSRFVPLLVGAPALRRYCLFGNLFATVGDETFRLDRHPTMSRHPVTPMNESDLRLHLARQTAQRIALFDILHLTGAPAELDERLARLLEARPEVVLFDVMDDARLAEAGRLIQAQCGERTLFVAGSSGVEYALVAHWRAAGVIPRSNDFNRAATEVASTKQIIVVSGSCSPVTNAQIEWAMEHGFAGIKLDAAKLADGEQAQAERAATKHKTLEALAAGRSPILYSAQGPDDAEIERTLSLLQARGLDAASVRERIGEQQGLLLRELLEATGLRRAVIAGGDTSSHAARQLGIFALELLAPIAPGSPLCRASSHDPRFDGLEIALKGGQGGKADYFECVRRGSPQ
ncbi:MAG: four-carbon acid sugar kinase family protein [Blastocatellia bacterium]